MLCGLHCWNHLGDQLLAFRGPGPLNGSLWPGHSADSDAVSAGTLLSLTWKRALALHCWEAICWARMGNAVRLLDSHC